MHTLTKLKPHRESATLEYVYRVFIDRIEFYAYHGVTPEERCIGHRYIVSLDMEVDGTADRTDRVEDTVNYAEAGQLAITVALEDGLFTLEKVAAKIAARILEKFPKVSEVNVRLSKLAPPAPYVAEEAGVEVVRRR